MHHWLLHDQQTNTGTIEEDPFDIEGIEKPSMKMRDYNELKMYLIKKIQEIL